VARKWANTAEEREEALAECKLKLAQTVCASADNLSAG
jgi:hypothetical protein